MRYQSLFEPISDDDPCGPDLDEIADDKYLNYTLSVDDRFPERYYDGVTGAPIEREPIDLKAEVSTISALLQRSRDLRLLSIEARFQILSGQIGGFSDCVQAMAGLLTRYWSDVHPKDYDGDFTLRQNTVSALAARGTVIFPLHNAVIVRDRRLGPVTYRHQMVVAGEVQSLPGAKALSASELGEALANPDNAATVAARHAEVVAALAAVREIDASFSAEASFEYAPDLDELRDTLQRMGAFIEAHVAALAPDRTGPSDAAVDEPSEGAGGSAAGGSAEGRAPSLAPTIQTASVVVGSRDAAKAALLEAERYYCAHEASSPALILVAQARQLVGKPFVEVLQTLVSDYADRAMIRIDADSGFHLTMNRMRNVTETLQGMGDGAAEDGSDFAFSASTRAEATALLTGVEAFLKSTEPSSPIPLLLEKARSFQNQDFRSILKSTIVR